VAYSYKKKVIGNQFLDFIKILVDQKYDFIVQIFLVIDNASLHKSNNVKQTLAIYYPRIRLVFLPPTRSPELKLIEV
jgi:hypothetical protein